MLKTRTISVPIACSIEQAYAFAHHPENFLIWAAGMAGSLRRDGERWVADTPEGEAEVRFSPPNEYGILDHHVVLPGKPEIYIPLRLIANREGCELIFTLFRQPDMDDAAWDRDEALVRKDLATLKALLESPEKAT
ncbi:SRPBCC family protein [Sphingomonas sp. MMS24-J13]|uniref:SRPBCC family protein n=1 Tax=Sphingomonas sp. MMS24-J13 TaxID=3238686 RepID=UPI003850B59D